MTAQREQDCPVTGIGASAGGLEALRAFFSAVKPDSGIAYVVVQHLDPESRSTLTELLGHEAKIPVSVIGHGVRVQPNHAYVIPPNASVTIDRCRLLLAPPTEPRGHRTPIDMFFTSLAHDQTDNAACVVLSGTGTDGTAGVRAIKGHGGFTLAQKEAEYDGMMRSAINTGLVDFVLPAGEMAAKLTAYFRHETDLATADGTNGDLMTRVFAVLRSRTGHDFASYKDKTILRRIQRRMQILQIADLPQFVERLQKDGQQVELLFQDLLIGVTNFFRDREAFGALEREVIPALFEGKGAGDTVRAWVAGCATGEEAYSIAMLLRERAPASRGTPRLQVFASDIDEHALEAARAGRYPASIAGNVSSKRLERFFQREGDTYRIASELREICLFSSHNLLRDAPFSKLDLISCRNLLIYLNADLQNRVIPLFHYSLRENGFLFLGTSENVSRHGRLFAPVDKPHRIFKRRAQADRRLPEFPLSAPGTGRHRHDGGADTADGSLQAVVERNLLDRYAPAYVVINTDGDVLLTSGRTGKYLELPAGAPQNNLFAMARRGLRVDLRAALHKASSTGQVAHSGHVSVGTNGGQQTIDLYVQPVRHDPGAEMVFLVVFQDLGGITPAPEPAAAVRKRREDTHSSMRRLEEELRATKERLHTTTEELESSNEELKSSNEELSSINEELQSANEELETSREELQSINEELQTVNSELNARVEELSRANSDVANLLESTQIATLFLNRDLAVKSFTPAAKDVFRLVDSDAGRPISHVRTRFGHETLEEDAARVMRTLVAVEKQVDSGPTGRRYNMRIMPYRTIDSVIDGVVVTFMDITEITQAEQRINELARELRDRVQRLETLLDLVPVGIFIAEGERPAAVQTNRYGAQLLGQSDATGGLRTVGQAIRLFQDGKEVPLEEQPLHRAARTGETITNFEAALALPDGGWLDVMILATALTDEQNRPRGAIAAIADISSRRKGEARQQELLHELEHRVKNILATVSSLAGRMLKDAPSLVAFSAAFQARLRAMAATHDLLSHGKWDGATLASLVTGAVETHAVNNHTEIRGPEVMVRPRAAATLGLVFHELATNAAKHGALATPEGRVAVSWTVERGPPHGQVALEWREIDGPAVRPPEKESFGLEFVRRSITYELQGSVDLAFAPDGLSCYVRFPLGPY